MRVTLVVNRHGTVSETFQRSLASLLVAEGHAVTVHALRDDGTAVVDGARRSLGLPPLGPGAAAGALVGLIRGPDRGLAVAARRARHRFGATAQALRAALGAGPILDTRPDVVHLGFSGLGVALADSLDLLDGVRLVVSCRGTDELVRPLLDPGRALALGRLVARADLVHVVAGAVGEAVVALGAPPERIRIVRPAVDLDTWTVRAEVAPHAGLRLVAVGRLEAAKGLDDLVAAVAMVREGGMDVRLRVVGDGPHRDALRLRIQRSGLAAVVELLGSRSPAEVRSEVAVADVFVSASHSEGISNGVLEALATGVPVISTAVGGMAEVIEDGRDGWLVPPGRPDRLAAALAAATDEGEARRRAIAGRQRVEVGFGLDRQRREWADLYQELADDDGEAQGVL